MAETYIAIDGSNILIYIELSTTKNSQTNKQPLPGGLNSSEQVNKGFCWKTESQTRGLDIYILKVIKVRFEPI